MKTSAFIAACGAVLCAAGPLQARRLFVKTKVVTTWVTTTTTVIEGDTATVFRKPGPRPKPTTTSVSIETSSTSLPPPPPPPPSSSSSSEVVVVKPTPDPTPEVKQVPPPTPDPVPSPSPSPSSKVEDVKPSPDPAPAPAPAPAPSQQPDAGTPSDYIGLALHHHNIHRTNHSAEHLSWSEEHARYAATLAKTCRMAHDTSIGGGGYGQNLAMWASSKQEQAQAFGPQGSLAKAITNGWYNSELEKFTDYGKASPNMASHSEWGHFTQVIWKGSQKVGCATQFCPPGTMNSYSSWYTVCNYYPPGNYRGQFDKNVSPPLGSAVVKAADP